MRIVILRKQKILLFLTAGLLMTLLLLNTWLDRSIPSLIRTPGTFYMIHTQDKVVALTFDDGPDPLFTGSILDILKKQQVKASFFVLGEAARSNPHLLSRMINEGHEIGNHGFTHNYTQHKLIEELTKTNQAVFLATNTHTYFYRPPGGRISKAQVQLIKDNGHVVTLWSLDSQDWLNPGPNRIIHNVIKAVFPGAIILLHDGGDKREQTVDALEQIIIELRARGYRFVTLSELRSLDS